MTDPFPGPFDSSTGDDHHHPPPPAPEPASWGLLVVGFALCVFTYVRFIRKHNHCACHHHE